VLIIARRRLAHNERPPEELQFVLVWKVVAADPATAGQGDVMNHKNFGACEDQIRSMLALNELGSEQRSKLNRARKKLNRAKREKRITREEIFEIVRELAEALVESCGEER